MQHCSIVYEGSIRRVSPYVEPETSLVSLVFLKSSQQQHFTLAPQRKTTPQD